MKLFDENQRYTNEASDIDSKIGNFLQPIFEEHLNKGGSVRELAAIAHSVVQDCMCMAIIGWDMEKRGNSPTGSRQ